MSYKSKLRKILLVLSVSFISFIGFSQNQRSIEKRKQELIQKEEERKAEDMQALKDMRAGHMAIQSKETKKRMKKSKKKAKRVNDHKGGFILKRLFKK